MSLLQNFSQVDQDLIAEAEGAFYQKKKTHVKRWIALAACLCLCICLTLPALAAAGNETAYALLYSISSQTAQKLKPVQVSCVDNGIEMKVEAAEIDGEKATILVSMRDTVGDRLDETTDLFDSYSIHTPYDQCGGCSLVDFDADTKTATFLLNIEQMNRVLIPGDKITFSVGEILSKKKHSDAKVPQMDMRNVPVITEFVKNPQIQGGSWRNEEKYVPLMQPQEDKAVPLTDGVTLTGYGYADGKLHMQLHFDDVLHTDNHGYVYLKDSSGETVFCECSVSFWDECRENSYEEYIFSIPAENLHLYEAWGEFWTCPQGSIAGDWQVTFPISEQ